MDAKILNWGLLSTAHINRRLIPALQKSKRNNLLGVASRELAKAQEYAVNKGIPKAYGSYDAMLDDPNIHVIYNPLPNHLHAEWTIKALQAGKHVLCEKPLALTLAEVDAMTEAARQSGKVLAEAFMYRHHPQTLKVKSLIDSGLIGKIKQIFGTFTYFMPYDNGNVRWIPEWGGGSLWDVGCYPVSYTRAILGMEPVEVNAWQITSHGGVDESFTGMLRFPGKTSQETITLNFTCGFRSIFHQWMKFVGETGTLHIPVPFNPGSFSWLWHWNGRSYKPIFVSGETLYRGEVEDLASAALDGQPQRVTTVDSRNNTAVLLALYQSARLNRPVTLEEICQP